jgi:preprotein translocase subunit SecD
MIARDKLKIKFAGIVLLGVVCILIAYPRTIAFWPKGSDFLNQLKVNLGLDLQGGIHLEYKADLSGIAGDKKDEAMQAIQDVIERRVNAFGVAEPVIYTAKSGSENRLIVELAGVKDINQAKQMIKETPLLEFKELGQPDQSNQIPQDVLDQMNAQAKKKAQDLLDQIKKGADFAQLAKDNSEDPGSKDKGGDLGFVKKGTLVPEFDKVLFDSNL